MSSVAFETTNGDGPTGCSASHPLTAGACVRTSEPTDDDACMYPNGKAAALPSVVAKLGSGCMRTWSVSAM